MITFYAGSGSPPSWRVWLALEHKRLTYELKLLSFSKSEHKTAEYLKINPRGKVPTLVDDGFAIYESTAIVEYLEAQYPSSGEPLLSRDVRTQAQARRLVCEVDSYLWVALEAYNDETIFKPEGNSDPEKLAAAKKALEAELARWEEALQGDWLAGSLSAADFAAFPCLAFMRRVGQRMPQHSLIDRLGPKTLGWMQRLEQLPYYERTFPPHWR